MSLAAILDAMVARGCTAREIVDTVHEYEAARLAAVSAHPPWKEQVAACFVRDGRVCAYCRDDGGPFHIDHIVPRSRGGTNALANLTVACRSCNASKKDRLLSEWKGAQ